VTLRLRDGVKRVAAFSADDGNPVFLSYARADGSQYAQELERTLRLEGFTTWRDARDLDLSADFTSEIENAIRSSVAVVLCLTPDTDRSDSFVRREIAFAQLAKKPIIVARFADITPPISVVNNTYIDFHYSREFALAQLIRFLREKASPSTSLPETARNSYLAALYHEIIDRLDDAIILPVVGCRMKLLEAIGTITLTKDPPAGQEILSTRYFQPAHGPVVGMGLRQALDFAKQRLAIVGPPGSGKTIALMALARDLASEAITDPDRPLPLLVSAASWEAGRTGFIEWLAREVPMLASTMADLIRSRQTILLVDGLDELPHTVQESEATERKYPRKEFISELPRSYPLVIASRPHEFQNAAADLGVQKAFELQPLTDAQVAAFIANIPEAAVILGQDDALRASARTPLMLALLCSALDAAGRKDVGHLTPSEARDLIVGSYVESRYERESVRQQDAATVPPSLQEIYQKLGALAMSDAGGGGNRNLFGETRVQTELGDDTYRLALNTNIMILTRGKAVRFYHPTLRDHFAFHYAQAAIHDPDPAVRDSAAWALWQIPDRRVVDLLIEALSDPYSYARGSAASALGRIGDPRAIGPLSAMLSDDTPVVSMYGNTIADVGRWAITQIHEPDLS
jgi:DNA polymerase III delta prime subunit